MRKTIVVVTLMTLSGLAMAPCALAKNNHELKCKYFEEANHCKAKLLRGELNCTCLKPSNHPHKKWYGK